MRKRLDLDPHELYEMRKQGMTNQQIANSLDVCVATVHKYLKGYAKAESKPEEGVSKLPPAEKLPEVMELRKIVAINGFSFDILPQEGKVQIWKSESEFHDLWYSVEQIDDLVSALKAVRKQFK
jgi:transposase